MSTSYDTVLTNMGGANRFLPYLLYKNILSPGRLVDIIRIAKKTLFPNGYLSPPPIDPTPEEQAAIREQLTARIQQAVPGKSSSHCPIYGLRC